MESGLRGNFLSLSGFFFCVLSKISAITVTANKIDRREVERLIVLLLLWFWKVLCGYLLPQLNRNIQILQVQSDDKESQAKRLITSMIIASIAVVHRITFLGNDQLKKLLECLLLDGTECEVLFRHFPKKQHLR